MPRLEFDGPIPSEDEVAAIASLIFQRVPSDGPAAPRVPAWTLAARKPELSLDDVRALAREGSAGLRMMDSVR